MKFGLYRIGKYKLQSNSFAILLHCFLPPSLLSPPEALSHNPALKRFLEMWENCLGSLGELASTSLQSWQYILNEAACNCMNAHPDRDPSPGTTPLMGTLNLKHRNIWNIPFHNSHQHSEKAQGTFEFNFKHPLCTRRFYLSSRVFLCALHELGQADVVADRHGLEMEPEDFPASGCIWQWHVDNSVYSPRPQQGLQWKHHSKSYSTSRK